MMACPVPTWPRCHNAFASPLNIEGYFENNQNSILVECRANLIKILMDRAWRKLAYRQKSRETRREVAMRRNMFCGAIAGVAALLTGWASGGAGAQTRTT